MPSASVKVASVVPIQSASVPLAAAAKPELRRRGGSMSGPRRNAASPLLARRTVVQRAGEVEKRYGGVPIGGGGLSPPP